VGIPVHVHYVGTGDNIMVDRVITPEEKEHFAMCVKCGEMFDRRSLDEVLSSKG
jgi:hypothetical protein